MKIIISVLLLLSFNANAQKLTHSEKNIWKKALKNMEETDQKYRQLVIASPEMNNDSIWNLQTSLDSNNRVKFIELTTIYGYPSRKKIGKEASLTLILHFTTEADFKNFKYLFKSELDKGNMLPEYYAWWYDRCQRNMGKTIFYGQYPYPKEYCGKKYTTYNERRKKIGLEPLKGASICD